MKKTKLLTSLAALALVVSLGACQESSKEEDKETSPSDVVSLIRERGAAISSWNGVDVSNWTTVSLYPNDLQFDLSGFLGVDISVGSFACYNYAQGVNTETGLDGLYHYVYYDGSDDTTRHEDLYFDGLDCYAYNNGEIIYNESGAKDYDISYFTANLVGLLTDEDESGLLYTLDRYVEAGKTNSGYSVTGSIEEASDGATSVGFYVVCYGDDGTTNAGYSYSAAGHITLEIDYDANGDISQFYYEVGDITSYSDGSAFMAATQVISYAPYEGEVEAPDWLEDYEVDGTTTSE